MHCCIENFPFQHTIGNPQKNVNAAEDFLEAVLATYIVTAALTIMDTHPDLLGNPQPITGPIPSAKQIAKVIVKDFTSLHLLTAAADEPQTEDEHVQYTKELITLGLLWYHYRDITREGDGDCFLKLTPVLLRLFKSANRKNYSKEMRLVQLQYHYLMSERMKMQLLYSRYINTHGTQGKNIACDLHMEHLNKLVDA